VENRAADELAIVANGILTGVVIDPRTRQAVGAFLGPRSFPVSSCGRARGH